MKIIELQNILIIATSVISQIKMKLKGSCKKYVRDFWLKLNIAKTAPNFCFSNAKQRKHIVSLNNETNKAF